MEDRHNHNQAPSNGFLMGVIIGGVATLLFTTKKGREIVKELTDKSIERFYDFEKKIESAKDDYEDIIDGDDYIDPVETDNIKLVKQTKPEKFSDEKEKIPTPSKPHKTVKKFFKKQG